MKIKIFYQKILGLFLAIFWSFTTLVNGQELARSDIPVKTGTEIFNTLSTNLKNKYVKLDSYIDLILMALLTQKHILAFGGPGGSKTALASDALGALNEKTFWLQFSPATKEDVIKGVQNVEKTIKEGRIEFNFEQSLLMHSQAILDEIDKANPEILTALLSILHERWAMIGDKKIEGKLQTAVITSNMTLYEFLQKFKSTGDENSGKAILDRVAFKILISNRLPEAEDYYEIFCKGPSACEIPQGLDLSELQKQVSVLKVPWEIEKLAYALWNKLLKVLEKQQAEEQILCKGSPREHPFPYIMTNQFSTRGAGEIIDIMQAARALAEIQKNPDVDLAQVRREWTPSDLRYAHWAMIMQGPGTLEGEEDLAEFEDVFSSDDRMLKMLQDLRFERNSFREMYEEVLKEYQDELEDLSVPGLNLLQLAHDEENYKKVILRDKFHEVFKIFQDEMLALGATGSDFTDESLDDPSLSKLKEIAEDKILEKIASIKLKIAQKQQTDSLASKSVKFYIPNIARQKALEQMNLWEAKILLGREEQARLIYKKEMEMEMQRKLEEDTKIKEDTARVIAEQVKKMKEEQDKYIISNMGVKFVKLTPPLFKMVPVKQGNFIRSLRQAGQQKIRMEVSMKFFNQDGFVLKDPTGLIWGGFVRDKYGIYWEMNYDKAVAKCQARGARMPTKLEMKNFREYLGYKKGLYNQHVFLFPSEIGFVWISSGSSTGNSLGIDFKYAMNLATGKITKPSAILELAYTICVLDPEDQ